MEGFLLPFPRLGATVSLGVHLVLEDCGHAVQPGPFGRRSLIVHGTPISRAAVFLHRADALAYPRGHVSLFANDDSLPFAVHAATRPNNRPVGTPYLWLLRLAMLGWPGKRFPFSGHRPDLAVPS